MVAGELLGEADLLALRRQRLLEHGRVGARPLKSASRSASVGPGYYQARTDADRKLRNHIQQIQTLGFTVTVTLTQTG